jgi:hypothetical protein
MQTLAVEAKFATQIAKMPYDDYIAPHSGKT